MEDYAARKMSQLRGGGREGLKHDGVFVFTLIKHNVKGKKSKKEY